MPGGWVYIPQPVTPNRLFGRPAWSFLGFGEIKGSTITLSRSRPGTRLAGPLYITAIPLYSIAVMTAVLPLISLVMTIRDRRRRHQGRCRRCGYSLTGNTSGVCPECGTPVAGKVEA